MDRENVPFPENGSGALSFRIGDWYVEPLLKRLSRAGESVQVEPRIMHVLVWLAGHPGEVVPRSDLLQAVWGDVVVNEEALTHAVSQLRRVFGDDPRCPRYIQTIHKTGYRLIAPVTPAVPREGPGSGPAAWGTSAEVPSSTNARLGVLSLVGRLNSLRQRRLYAVVGVLVVVAVVISVLAILSSTTSSLTPRPIPLAAIPFTSYPGHEVCPAMSPDGTRIAFSWYTEERGNYDLFVKQRNTEVPLRLTDTEGNEFYAAWSPDGSDIAYGLLTGDGAAIFVVPAIGGASRKLVDLPFGIAGIDWSPDGHYLAYASREVASGPNRIHLYSFATGEKIEITEPCWSSQGDFRPAFSPDGLSIAFIRGDRTWLQDIFLVPAGGGKAERLTSSQHKISGLDFMPDGKSLVFSAGPSSAGDMRLWRLSLKNRLLTWLPTAGHRSARPSIAMKVSKLVYEDEVYECDIERIVIDGTDRGSAPIVTSTRVDYGPQYSPGGKYISFISNRSGSPQIWICDGNGDICRQLTDFEDAYIKSPCWSYDERHVAFTAAPGSYTAIYVADVETGEVDRLSTSDRHEMCLGWSTDGDWLYCKSAKDDDWWVYKIRIDGGETVEIMKKDVFRLAESADGRSLIYSRSDTTGVWSSATDGSSEVCLVNEPGYVVPCGWRETLEGVYFFNLYEGSVCLWFMDAATGQSSMLASEADFRAVDLDVAPDGEAVIFDRVRHTGSDLCIVENL